MKLCINPWCQQRENPDDAAQCQNCRTTLLINNRYRLIKPLCNHKTTSTELFEIEDVKDPQKTKVLKVLINNNPTSIKLFAREQQFLIHYRHQGIPKGEVAFSIFLDRGEELPCLVMEKIEGQDLEEWLQEQGAINQEQACQWLKEILTILDFIHKKGVLHRDIKPSNIMRCNTEKLVLIDFNIARNITATIVEGRNTTRIFGTEGYAPHEQFNRKAGRESDFYALGRTFVHLLTGIHPSEMEVLDTLDTWHKNTKYPISPSFVALINWLMEYFPQKRPKNAKVILQRLHQIQHPNPMFWLNRTGFAVAIIAGIIIGINFFSPKVCDSKINDWLSCGEEILISGDSLLEKQQGVQAFRAGKYQEAIAKLEKAWYKQHDPETLIYLNNARINLQARNKVRTIAIVVSLGYTNYTKANKYFNQEKAIKHLYGVAQAQNEAIAKGLNLQVLIAADANDLERAPQIAKLLGRKPNILAVLGHNTSEATQKAMPIYAKHRLVLVSPSCPSTELSNGNREPEEIFFFRVIPTNRLAARSIAQDLPKINQEKKVAIFANPHLSFSRSYKEELQEAFALTGQVEKEVKVFDLSQASFNPEKAIATAKQQGAKVIVLIPDVGSSPYGLPNALKVIKSPHSRDLLLILSESLYYYMRAHQVAVNHQLFVNIWNISQQQNTAFSNTAKNLWYQENVAWETVGTYDSTLVLMEALQRQPSREGVQKVLSDSKFKTTGVTGVIEFERGDRKENPNQPGYVLVKVVPKCANAGFGFLPVDKELKCL